MKKVTIIDVAKKSGISKTTVSRYINGMNVSSDKVIKIEKAIDELGYVKNSFAELLKTNKSNLIGLVIPDVDNPFFLKIIKRLEVLSEKDGKTLIMKVSNRDLKTEIKAIKFIQSFRVDALFLCRSELSDEEIEKLNLRIPVISIDKVLNSIPSIISNNEESAYTLTNHLIGNVENNILFFCRAKESTSVMLRYKGFSKAATENNKNSFIYQYDYEDDIDYQGLTEFIIKNNIEGIICRNDNEAIKLAVYFNTLYTLDKLHRIKICGFDNVPLSRQLILDITTVDQNVEVMCDIGYEIIKENNLENSKLIVHPAELIVRKSSQ